MTDEYFTAYNDPEVHRIMLADLPRMSSYYNALKALDLSDKVVMDVGGGTGVLSMMAARLGAKRVYCIEASKMADVARKLIYENGLDTIVTVIEKRAEDLVIDDFESVSLSGSKVVDLIMSEWMGFHLYHENMLPSVLVARDLFLIPHGQGGSFAKWQLLPSTCSLSIAAADLSAEYYERHGLAEEITRRFDLDLSGLAGLETEDPPRSPDVIQLYDEKSIEFCHGGENFHVLDITTAPVDFMNSVEGSVTLKIDAVAPMHLHGFVIYWQCDFIGADESSRSAILSTRPGCKTHWKQSVLWLPPLSLDEGQHQEIDLQIKLEPSQDDPRHVLIDLSIHDVR